MTTIVAACRHACRQQDGRVKVLGQRLLSSSAAVHERTGGSGNEQSRLDALRERLRVEEEESVAAGGVSLHDFSFSGEVSYGTAVPRRTRDKSGKVRFPCLREHCTLDCNIGDSKLPGSRTISGVFDP